jgi:hypothetical protein
MPPGNHPTTWHNCRRCYWLTLLMDVIQVTYVCDCRDRKAVLIIPKRLRYAILTFILVWVVVTVGAPIVKHGTDSSTATTLAVIAAILGALAEADAGTTKAFGLRLQAQQVLCQLQIEMNTRAQGHGVPVAQATAAGQS